MTKVNVYITFNGNCEQAFNFYKEAFGGEFQYIGRYKDVPPSDKQKFQHVSDDKIMHVSLPISQETILMGCDNPGTDGDELIAGNNISLSIDTDQRERADQIFNKHSVGGDVKMQMNETFWGAYFGVLRDRFGINWSINCDLKEHP